MKPANEVSPAQALQTILARQSLLISAVSNLTEMLENLPYTNDGQRNVASSKPEEGIRKQEVLPEQFKGHLETIENGPAPYESVTEPLPTPTRPLAAPARGRRFGAMSRRRRYGTLVVLLALLTSAVLVAYAAFDDEGDSAASQEKPSRSSQEVAMSDPEETASTGPDAAALSDSAASDEEEGYENFAREQPLYRQQYQAQDATSGLASQERPVPQLQSEGTGLPRLTFGNNGVQPAPGSPIP
jgi:hypothetical protein